MKIKVLPGLAWMQGERDFHSLLLRMLISPAFLDTIWTFLKHPEIEIPFDPATLLLRIYPKGPKNAVLLCFLQHYSQQSKFGNNPNYPRIDNWMKTLWYTNTMEYCSAISEVEVMQFTDTWRDLKSIILSQISWKVTNIMISLLCGI